MKKFYITTSIPYTNAAPHIGHALEIIQADVLARYNRFLKKEVFFLTGTDEHGQKTLKAAEDAGKSPQDFADQISSKFKQLTQELNISNDDFIRTTDKNRHLPSVYKLWDKYRQKGDIYKKKYKGFYCYGCEAFKTQKELIDKKCPIHQREVEIVEEENYFFKLTKYIPEIKKLIEKNKIEIIPEGKRNEILKIIDSGIDDVSFSRSKEKYWSWPVPEDSSQVFYVWQDALPNYLSAIGYDKETPQFKKLWPADVHCIGKDIIKFHAIFWPAMLLSAGLELPKKIFVHGFITVGGQKMSKSIGNVVDPFELIDKYGADAVRYYLLREITSSEDGDFTYQKFESRYNSDLAGGIGNLVSRIRAMADKKGIKPASRIKNLELKKEISKMDKNCKKAMDSFKFNEALKSIWDLISWCDKHINDNKPWEEKKESSEIISDLIIAVDKITESLRPFMPESCDKISKKVKGPLFPRI